MVRTQLCDVCRDDLEHQSSVELDIDPDARYAGGELRLDGRSLPWPRERTDVDLCIDCAEDYGILGGVRELGEFFAGENQAQDH